MALELLLAREGDGQPVLRQGLGLEALPVSSLPESEMPTRLWDPVGDASLLPKQRWGLVAPQGPAGERLLALVAPLRRARQEAQGGAPVRVYRVPPDLDGPRAARWKGRVFRQEGVPEAELPRYLLLLGGLDQVSLELQQALSTDAFVGRLVFPSTAGYEAYVAKVLQWEATPSPAPQARMLFYTARDGTDATEAGYNGLIAPSVAACRERQQGGQLPAAEVLELMGEGERAAGQLLTRAAEPGPSVLFSLTHGVGPPKQGWSSVSRQHELQGALLLPGGRYLSGAELASRPFLPGGIWFCFACFSAATPARSAYAHWLSQLASVDPDSAQDVTTALPRTGERPFIAALPQAVLANPEGPLAVLGHVDLAWTFSFRDQGRGVPSRFFGLLQALAERHRAGAALGTLLRFFNEKSIELTTLYDEEEHARHAGKPSPIDPLARACLWLLRQDLQGYILLGDPAVRLPLASPARQASVPPPLQDALAAAGLSAFMGSAQAAPPREATGAEKAIIALLTGQLSPEDIATRHGISARELRRWEELYRAAGRAALSRYLSGEE